VVRVALSAEAIRLARLLAELMPDEPTVPGRPDSYVVQAAIAACHALAPTYADTNWDAVIPWYDVLLTVQDTPVVRLNRAAAGAERDGPGAGLALVDSIDGLAAYPWW
jgi:RNA polymerase sigma-70 factor (ECF subfamily)